MAYPYQMLMSGLGGSETGREIVRTDAPRAKYDGRGSSYVEGGSAEGQVGRQSTWNDRYPIGARYENKTVGWQPTCEHKANPVPAMVLDPFVGSGTTAVVAQKFGRHAVGVDLSAEYLELAAKRVGAVTLPMALT